MIGAPQALRTASKDRPDQFLGGFGDEPEAVSEIKKSDSAYKAGIALSSPVIGFAMAVRADWFEGKSVPKAMDILLVALAKNNTRITKRTLPILQGIPGSSVTKDVSPGLCLHLLRCVRSTRNMPCSLE